MGTPIAETGHARRLVSEQAVQLLLVGSGFVDRLLLTAFMLRVWGVNTFEIWSACIAFAGLVSLFELGFNYYFNNQLTIEMERGDVDAFRRTLATGNLIFGLVGLFGILFSVIVIWSTDPTGSGYQSDAMWAATLLSVAAATRLAMCAINAQYRANRQFARFALIAVIAEVGRILAIFALVLTGFGLLGVALGSAVTTIGILFVFVMVDTTRRFFPHRYVVAWPYRRELWRITTMSSLYLGQLIPVVLWTSLPVLYLQNLGMASGMLASFVLLRTLANVARTPMQSLGVVYGQECGRRIAVEDLPGALRVVASGARLFAVLSGLTSGLLLFGGYHITKLWTGSAGLYDPLLMAGAVAPMVIAAATVLVHNVLICAQAPARPAIARWLQMVVTVVAYLLLPWLSPPVRMMMALAIGEIAGYAPLAYDAMARLIPGTGIGFHLRNIAVVLGSFALGGVTIEAVLYVTGTSDSFRLMLALGVTAVLFGIYILLFGIPGEDRRRLWRQTVQPQLARFGLAAPHVGDK